MSSAKISIGEFVALSTAVAFSMACVYIVSFSRQLEFDFIRYLSVTDYLSLSLQFVPRTILLVIYTTLILLLSPVKIKKQISRGERVVRTIAASVAFVLVAFFFDFYNFIYPFTTETPDVAKGLSGINIYSGMMFIAQVIIPPLLVWGLQSRFDLPFKTIIYVFIGSIALAYSLLLGNSDAGIHRKMLHRVAILTNDSVKHIGSVLFQSSSLTFLLQASDTMVVGIANADIKNIATDK